MSTTTSAGRGGSTTGPRTHAATKPRRRGFVEWIVILALALLAAFLIRTYLIESYVIPTPSMYPTIMDGDRVLVNKLSYDFGNSPHLGDIVVFNKPPADTNVGTPILIKRVIGLPGQTIQSGPRAEILINGKEINQPWLTAGARASPGPAIAKMTIPKGDYFVMGDNRGDSEDSRYFGTITDRSIIGRAFVRIWPLSRLHWF